MNDLFEQSLKAVFTDNEIDPDVLTDYKQHKQLFLCIKNHDSKKAVKVIEQHLKHADNIFRQHLEKLNYSEDINFE